MAIFTNKNQKPLLRSTYSDSKPKPVLESTYSNTKNMPRTYTGRNTNKYAPSVMDKNNNRMSQNFIPNFANEKNPNVRMTYPGQNTIKPRNEQVQSGVFNNPGSKTSTSKTSYSDQIYDMLSGLTDQLKSPRTYDSSQDEGFQAAQTNIGKNVYEQMNRRNVADSNMTSQQAYELSMSALPQFQQAWQQNQQQDINNQMNMLSQLSGLDQADKQIALQEGQLTGNYLTPEQSAALKNIDPGLNQYSDNFQEEINRRSAINPQDPAILQLQYLRNQKIKNQNLQYAQSQLGERTLAGSQADIGNAQAQAQLTGMYLSQEQQRISKEGVNEQDRERIDNIVSQLGGGYQEYMNSLDKNSIEYTKAQMLRNNKIQSQGLNYETSLGQQTQQSKQLEQQLQQDKERFEMEKQQFDVSIASSKEDLQTKRTNNQYLAQQIQASLTGQQLQNAGQLINNSINQLNLDYLPQEKQLAIKSIQQSLAKGNLDMAYQEIVNANLPAQLEAQLNQAFAGVENTYANTNRTNLESSLLGSGGGATKYTQSDVNNKVAQYMRNFGDYDKVEGKFKILDKKRDGIPDNQNTILAEMKKEYANSGNDGTYNMLKEAALKLGISNSDFVKTVAYAGLSSSGNSGGKAVSLAQKYSGTKYVWGGNSLSKGVDCSGLTQQVFKAQGIDLPRTAYEQSKAVKTIPQSQLKVGDLVFFDTVQNNGKPVDHVGIYAGNGKMTHASSSKGVVTVSMNTNYWQSKFTKAGRP